MTQNIWLVPLFPLIGFLVVALNFRRFSGITAGLIASGAVLLAFISSVLIYLQVVGGQAPQTITIFNWIQVNTLSISLSFLIDRLSALMLLIVTGVGFLIHVYSIGYMREDAGFNRFFSWMNLFIFFMLLLVLGANYLVMFIGWEGVGLCSYLLIGFWFKNQEYNNAAKKAFIMNRIGDLGFLLALFFFVQQFGSLDFITIFNKAQGLTPGTSAITLITMLLFTGAVGKSAQIPLFTWLPDAMAGPTPVSALIHAATMVTAGIYMIVRSNVLFVLAPTTMMTIMIIGIITALMAGSIAIFQSDIKKVLAYSTVSQLGLMFVALGVGSFTGAMFHLTTHAFFKALLFLAAGSVIHALGGEQDIRKMGGLRKEIPTTFKVFFIGTLAIAGVPPLAGFFSKDMILAAAFKSGTVIWTLSVIVALMTVVYMFRLLFVVFWGKARFTDNHLHVHESPRTMTIPMTILAFLSIVGGFLGIPEVLGGSDKISEYLAPVLSASAALQQHHATEVTDQTQLLLMLVPLVLILVLIYIAWQKYGITSTVDQTEKQRSFIPQLLYRKYYIDELYEVVIQKPVAGLSTFLHEIVEVKGIDRFVNWVGDLVVLIGQNIRYIQTGNVGNYLFYMVISIILILFFNLFN